MVVSIYPPQLSGAKVRRLRLALGLGQVELAQRVGVAAGTISMMENGRAVLHHPGVEALAAVLDCDPTYLYDQRPEEPTTVPRLRAYADAPQRVVERAVADAVTAVDAARVLNLRFVPNLVPLFDADSNDDHEIERVAADARTLGDVGPDEPIKNATRFVERLGCVVLPMDSELGRHLGISLRVGGVPVVRASRTAVQHEHAIPGDRQRFTVSHELGHLVLHHAERQPASPAEANKLEKQASRFASALLAPGDAVLQDLDSLGGRVTLNTLAQLKEKWGLAIKAFVIRFQQLSVIDDDHARSLYKQISARRWNKSEPVKVGNESAVWFKKALAKASAGTSINALLKNEAGLGAAYADRWTNWEPVNWLDSGALVSPMPPRGSREPRQSASELDAGAPSGSLVRLPARNQAIH